MAKAMESNSKSRKETILIKYAIFSRLLVLFLTILWRSLLQPYDTSAAFNPPCLYQKDVATEDSPPLYVANATISKTLENSIVWDSVYFVRITECGYEYEQTYAFLPLLPFFISLLARSVFAPLVPLIGLRAVMVLSCYIVSNLAFILAAIYLFRTLRHHLELQLSSVSIQPPYSIRQCNVFKYSESLYALFSIGGVYHLLSGSSNIAALWFALSSCARSNGVLNAGYICFQTMHRAYEDLYQKRRVYVSYTYFIQVSEIMTAIQTHDFVIHISFYVFERQLSS